MTAIHPIELESYRILRERVDLSHLGGGAAAVVARMIHASADVEYATTTVVGEHAVDAGIAAMRAGAPVVTDVEMTRVGLSGVDRRCFLDHVGPAGRPTRSAAAMRIGATEHRDGAIFVVGCAPTALIELMAVVDEGRTRPALVIGLPVGFVGAAESKELLRQSPLASIAITNIGEKGGSAVAAAAFNAIARSARD
ncbi:MAG: Precorrin-8X methylmutase CbiC/CobH [Acidimicrobiales bacterium]|nr:Precorrin-8X methylmutase CbiC/CobH [Acidimicrobiales bacterium]